MGHPDSLVNGKPCLILSQGEEFKHGPSGTIVGSLVAEPYGRYNACTLAREGEGREGKDVGVSDDCCRQVVDLSPLIDVKITCILVLEVEVWDVGCEDLCGV